MRLRDFVISAGPGFTPTARAREVNLLLRPVGEEIRFGLGRYSIEAPFAKLIVSVASVESDRSPDDVEPMFEDLLDVARVTVGLRESEIRTDRERRFVAVLKTTEKALAALEEATGWASPDLQRIVDETWAKGGEVGIIGLESLTRTDRKTGRCARVFYRIAENAAAIDVIVTDRDDRVIRSECVAESFAGDWPESFFPVRSSIMKDGVFLLRDAGREPLAAVLVRDVIELRPG